MVLANRKKCCLCKHSEGLHKFMFPSNILIFNEWVRVAGVDLTLQDRNKAFLCSRNMPLISFFLLLYYHLAQNHLNNITIWIIYTVCNIEILNIHNDTPFAFRTICYAAVHEFIDKYGTLKCVCNRPGARSRVWNSYN